MNIDKELNKTSIQYWLESYQHWKNAKQISGWNGFVMHHINNSRKNLAKAIREAEKKLGREHRRLPHCGCVQYMGAE